MKTGAARSPLASALIAASFGLAFFIPQYAFAATGIFTFYDPNTQQPRDDVSYTLENDGVHAVPFNVLGYIDIDIELEPFYAPAGEIFFIPNPESEERELVGDTSEFTWTQEGIYELDIYQFILAPNLSPWERFLAYLLPQAHAAPPNWEYVETIRFQIIEGALPNGPCCSSVLFLPGIEGSALKEGGSLLWPSSIFSDDVARLALTEDGESVNNVQVSGVLENFVPGVDIYGGFASFMDSLSEEDGDGTIREWLPFGYDWRLSIQKSLDEGAFWESEGEVVRLIEQVENLAQSSKTGKVTIIAHSMGGILGKALIKKLEEEGMEYMVDAFVMVGTPQLGTPEAVVGLLHGRQALQMELFLRSHTFRNVVRNMESAHALLPSEEYFNTPGIPAPVTFSESADFTEDWRDQWGTELDTSSELTEFLGGTGVDRERPSETNLARPEVLRPELLSEAASLHTELDSYEFPSNIRVVQIAGWGLPTVESIEYKKKHIIFDGYEPSFTREGDATVVYPTAISSGGEKFYFNIFEYNENVGAKTQHRDLTSAEPVKNLVSSILHGNSSIDIEYISTIKPSTTELEQQLLVSTKSPVILGAYDSEGNFTGINPDQDLESEVLEISGAIPGSTFLAIGEDQYIFLPENDTYTFIFKGTGNGPATIETSKFSGNTVAPIATYTDIPVTSSTEATFIVNSSEPQETTIQVDDNGDGIADSTITPDGYIPTPSEPTISELIGTLKVKIQILSVSPKLKEALLKKLGKMEERIEKQKQRKSKILDNFLIAIEKKTSKGKIDSMAAAEITTLLTELEARIAVFPLSPVHVQELRIKVETIAVTPKVRTNLLQRIERLERMTSLIASLERFTLLITNKMAQGKVTDAEGKELLSLLGQIEAGL